MSREEIVYSASDAWLLLSIILAARAGQASLEKIIAAGDYINHAIFIEGEMERGLYRLNSGGYIENINGLFKPTSLTLEKYEVILGKKKQLLRQMEMLREFIGAKPWRFAESDPQPETRRRYPGFTSEKFAEAVEAYQQNASEVIKRLSKKS